MGLNVNIKGLLESNSVNEIIKGKNLRQKFEEFIKLSDSRICWIKGQDSPYEFELFDSENKKYHIVAFVKCISEAGWIQKPHMKRVQVKNIRFIDEEKFLDTNEHQTNMILGLYFYQGNFIMAGWNAYKYIYHEKQRSCYIDVNAIQSATINGYHECEVSKQKVWVFKPDEFTTFVKSYIKYNDLGL